MQRAEQNIKHTKAVSIKIKSALTHITFKKQSIKETLSIVLKISEF